MNNFIHKVHFAKSTIARHHLKHISLLPTKYPLFTSFSFVNYPEEYIVFVANVLDVHEPQTYQQAKDDLKWVDAMNKELLALESNDI